MTVLTGRSARLYADGVRVARCSTWTLDEQRPMLDSTPVDSWDKEVVPGRRSGTGSTTVYYDPEDAAANTFFDSILLDSKNEVGISLMLDSLTGESFPVAVHVSNVSHAVQTKNAQVRSINFKLTDVGLELNIVGSPQVSKGGTKLYTAQVFGLSGAWVYAWSITSGPTITSPTSPSTNINFPDLGSFTLVVTATLGATVLTASLVISVIDVPLMWVSRMTSPSSGIQGASPFDAATAVDPVEQHIYHGAMYRPDVSLGSDRIVLSKFSYAANRLATKAVTGTVSGSSVRFIQVLADGSIFVVLTFSSYVPHMFRLSADMSTILWQVRLTGSTGWGGGVYDPATNRVYFNFTYAFSTFHVGYVEMSTGAITKVNVTPSPAPSANTSMTPVITNAGTVLFGLSSDRIVLLEFNKSLQVSSLYTAIKVVEHQGVNSSRTISTLLETDNYYAVLGVASGADDLGITLFNKSDLSFASGRRFGSHGLNAAFDQNGGGAYFDDGEFTVWTGYYFGSGLTVAQIAEDLSSASSVFRLAPFSTLAPISAIPCTQGYGGAFQAQGDKSLGLLTTSMFQGPGTEYMAMFRANYATGCEVEFSASPFKRMVAYNILRPPGAGFFNTPATVTSSFNRTYTYAVETPATASSTLSISNETQITFQEYVLGS